MMLHHPKLQPPQVPLQRHRRKEQFRIWNEFGYNLRMNIQWGGEKHKRGKHNQQSGFVQEKPKQCVQRMRRSCSTQRKLKLLLLPGTNMQQLLY
mmetsp:Transcript_53156/g.154779  ORF Transcript_53156/g.154779 Transcript_53156/m.154779 type:complete len:94 (-) Transcript_53156:113-394(-)